MQIKFGSRPIDYEPPEPEQARCPCCGGECDTVYRDRYGVIFGCEECVDHQDAADAPECWQGSCE